MDWDPVVEERLLEEDLLRSRAPPEGWSDTETWESEFRIHSTYYSTSYCVIPCPDQEIVEVSAPELVLEWEEAPDPERLRHLLQSFSYDDEFGANMDVYSAHILLTLADPTRRIRWEERRVYVPYYIWGNFNRGDRIEIRQPYYMNLEFVSTWDDLKKNPIRGWFRFQLRSRPFDSSKFEVPAPISECDLALGVANFNSYGFTNCANDILFFGLLYPVTPLQEFPLLGFELVVEDSFFDLTVINHLYLLEDLSTFQFGGKNYYWIPARMSYRSPERLRRWLQNPVNIHPQTTLLSSRVHINPKLYGDHPLPRYQRALREPPFQVFVLYYELKE